MRIKLNGVDGSGVIERVRGYQRKTDRLLYLNVSTRKHSSRTTRCAAASG
jgi:hypothetical protein